MFNPNIILSFLGAKCLSDAIAAIAYIFDGDRPDFFSYLVASIGFYIMIHFFLKRTEESK